MEYIAARDLQVGDVFYAQNVLHNRTPFVVIGVGEATSTYKHGFLWRKTSSYKVTKVMAEEIIGGWDPARYWADHPSTLGRQGFTYGPSDGIWIENRKDNA